MAGIGEAVGEHHRPVVHRLHLIDQTRGDDHPAERHIAEVTPFAKVMMSRARPKTGSEARHGPAGRSR